MTNLQYEVPVLTSAVLNFVMYAKILGMLFSLEKILPFCNSVIHISFFIHCVRL